MIRAIIFDFGGVLSIEPGLLRFGDLYAKKLGGNPEEFKRAICDNWDKAVVNEISSKEFWENLAGVLKTDAETMRKDFMHDLGVRQEGLELARELKKGYKLAMLSNQIEDWLEEVIEKHKMREVFDVIVTSYESRLAKPDIRIFKETVEKLGVKPEECVYIDDMEKNIAPAEELGMKMILFKDLEQLKKELKGLGVEVA
jgi:putative hydrolase of the HAD superfamily